MRAEVAEDLAYAVSGVDGDGLAAVECYKNLAVS